METAIFLSEPQCVRYIKILSWNINGAKTKLEKKKLQEVLLNYDIISLNEVKKSLAVSFPGYVFHKSAMRGSQERRGTVLLV